MIVAELVGPPHASKESSSRKPRGTQWGRVAPPPTARYAPRSERWEPIVMFTCVGLGILVIVANYVSLLPGDEPRHMYLLLGLVLITTGFITATRSH